MRPNGRRSTTTYVLDRAAVRAVDRAAIDEYGIPGLVLMENAARGLASVALEMLEGAGASPAVLIVCGSGNNGGDGYALARHLHNAGVAVTLAALGAPRAGTDAAVNRDVCRAMGLVDGPEQVREHAESDLVVDAIFGTGLDRPVRDDAAGVIERINAGGRPVLAVDLPSGLDCDTGRPLGVAVRATHTVTFVGLKPAMTLPHAREFVGKVTVAGIGAPVELRNRFGRRYPP